MKIILLCSVNNLDSISEDIDLLKFKLMSNTSKLDDIFKNEGFKRSIGRLELSQFESGCFFYGEMDLKTVSEEEISESEIKILQDNITIYYGILENYISFLWFTRDNCCSLNSLYAYVPSGNRIMVRKAIPTISTSKGDEGVKTKFTSEEFLAIGAMYIGGTQLFYHRNLRPKTEEDKPQEDLIEREIIPYDFKKQTRIERAFHFLVLARRSNQLALKISFYICIYETLFYGTTSSEISHQIAERAALYFSNTRYFRHSIYKQIKEAYKIRSTYFHGNSFQGYKKDLSEISFYLDNITREILYRIMSKDHKIFLQKDKLLELSFLDMLFEDERKPDGLTFESGIEHIRFRK